MLKKHAFYPGDIPTKPGCYLYRDVFGTVIYVGKASNLRRRMSQYFQPSRETRADAKLRSLINSIQTWEYITVRSEDEALILETRLIKEFAPYYNILMRDDKRMLMIKIDRAEKFPRIRMARLKKDDSSLYFGPYPKGGNLRIVVDYLNRALSLRTCKAAIPGAEERAHCLAGSVRDCCRPCVGNVTEAEYNAKIDRLVEILSGDTKEIEAALDAEMREAALKQQYEKAARFRDVREVFESICAAHNRNFARMPLPQGNTGPEAVADLRDALLLPVSPDTIECFDISNISGTLAVASLVHFRDGRPDKSRYRRFRIRTVEGPNDFAMMAEAVKRHFTRLMDEQIPFPALLMVDGGKGQLSSTLKALVEIKSPPFPVIGLAKRQEEVFIPGSSESILIPHDRPALKLLQAVRDEAHRFAITYHRQLRLDTIRNSLLDEIEGIGDARKQALLREFGSVRNLRHATAEEIQQRVSGIGPEYARIVVDFLKAHAADGAIDPL